MSVGRVFRKTEQAWEPVGAVLPQWDHVAPRPDDPMAVWVLPGGEGYVAGDVIAFAETAHQLISPVGADDVAWQNVMTQALSLYEGDQVQQWMSSIELWLAMRLPEGWRQ